MNWTADGYIVSDATGQTVAIARRETSVAHLIAAAPELLEALQGCWANGMLPEPLFAQVRAAIAKATGDSNAA